MSNQINALKSVFCMLPFVFSPISMSVYAAGCNVGSKNIFDKVVIVREVNLNNGKANSNTSVRFNFDQDVFPEKVWAAGYKFKKVNARTVDVYVKKNTQLTSRTKVSLKLKSKRKVRTISCKLNGAVAQRSNRTQNKPVQTQGFKALKSNRSSNKPVQAQSLKALKSTRPSSSTQQQLGGSYVYKQNFSSLPNGTPSMSQSRDYRNILGRSVLSIQGFGAMDANRNDNNEKGRERAGQNNNANSIVPVSYTHLTLPTTPYV